MLTIINYVLRTKILIVVNIKYVTKVVKEYANPQLTPPTSNANGIVRIINTR